MKYDIQVNGFFGQLKYRLIEIQWIGFQAIVIPHSGWLSLEDVRKLQP